nr:12217_t:CDS:2 [Entrophospora candida]
MEIKEKFKLGGSIVFITFPGQIAPGGRSSEIWHLRVSLPAIRQIEVLQSMSWSMPVHFAPLPIRQKLATHTSPGEHIPLRPQLSPGFALTKTLEKRAAKSTIKIACFIVENLKLEVDENLCAYIDILNPNKLLNSFNPS